MSQASYRFALADLDAEQTAFIDCPTDFQYTRRINGYSESQGKIVSEADWGKMDVYERALKVYRNGVLRHMGQIVDPFIMTPEAHEFVTKDPYAGLAWRRVRRLITFTDTFTDQMAWTLIDRQNEYRSTFLREGSLADTVQKTKAFRIGEVVSEKIDWLAEMPSSFWFRIDAVDDPGSGEFGSFNTFADADLDDKSDTVFFHYGQDTYDNCTDYRVEKGLIRNRATLLGADGTTPETGENLTSIENYGLWEDERGHVLTKDQDFLEELVGTYLIATPCRVFSLTPGPDAPAPFTDFDVGDTVGLKIRDRGFNFTGTVRINEFTVKVDPNSGEEIVEQVVMEE